MADVLSQSEIDALLKQLSSGELDAEDFTEESTVKIKDYDLYIVSNTATKKYIEALESKLKHKK